MDNQLVEIKIALAKLIAKNDEVLRTLAEKVEEHDELIHGNGHDGMKTKLERLMDRQDTQRWHFRAIWTAMIGIGARLLYGFFVR